MISIHRFSSECSCGRCSFRKKKCWHFKLLTDNFKEYFCLLTVSVLAVGIDTYGQKNTDVLVMVVVIMMITVMIISMCNAIQCNVVGCIIL
jgi:hypothetical protein